MSESACPLCGGRMDADPRHPRRVCETCVGRAADENGRPLRFFNMGFSGGFVARFADDGTEREGHECVIDGVRCWADEAYLGGIVVEVAADGEPSTRGPQLRQPAHEGTSHAGPRAPVAPADRRAGTATAEAGRAPVAPPVDLAEQLRAAQEKAWWKDLADLVGPTDRQLVVIQPRADATPAELLALGQALARWKDEYELARHIWGLTDLLAGRPPRTPPLELAVPVFITKLEERHEPVALVYVAQEANLQVAAADLHQRLAGFLSRLAWFGSPDEYSDQRR